MLVNNIKDIEYKKIYGIVDDKGEKRLYILTEENECNMKFSRVLIIQNNNKNRLAMEDNRHRHALKIYTKKKLEQMIESGQIEELVELKVHE
ncbi:MAG: hypothetical protein ACLR5O_00900 [Romboutsia timonensis]|uniref:hypothetical protein n=1 Tax=Romboutsia timonensis TaxID=1776391 RepID=UPI0039A1F09F